MWISCRFNACIQTKKKFGRDLDYFFNNCSRSFAKCYRRAHYRPFLTRNPALSPLSLKALGVKMAGSKLSHWCGPGTRLVGSDAVDTKRNKKLQRTCYDNYPLALTKKNQFSRHHLFFLIFYKPRFVAIYCLGNVYQVCCNLSPKGCLPSE